MDGLGCLEVLLNLFLMAHLLDLGSPLECGRNPSMDGGVPQVGHAYSAGPRERQSSPGEILVGLVSLRVIISRSQDPVAVIMRWQTFLAYLEGLQEESLDLLKKQNRHIHNTLS